jgi:hypothetical protein
MLLVLRKAPRLSAPQVDGWRSEHVHDLNVPAKRAWMNRYSAGDLPYGAPDFLASVTIWAHTQTGINKGMTRLCGDPPKVRTLATCNVLPRWTHYHAIERAADASAAHLGHVQRSVFTKAGIERAIRTTGIGLQALPNCSLLILDLEYLPLELPAGAQEYLPLELPCRIVQVPCSSPHYPAG